MGSNDVDTRRSGLYVSLDQTVADAFAFRDARSRLISEYWFKLGTIPGETKSYVYQSRCDEPDLMQDPDFPYLDSSKYTTDSLKAHDCIPGTVNSWRDLTSILGPHQLISEGVPAYDYDGNLTLIDRWKEWGYTSDDLAKLGPWFPSEHIWENTNTGRLFAVGEDALLASGGVSPRQYPLHNMTPEKAQQIIP